MVIAPTWARRAMWEPSIDFGKAYRDEKRKPFNADLTVIGLLSSCWQLAFKTSELALPPIEIKKLKQDVSISVLKTTCAAGNCRAFFNLLFKMTRKKDGASPRCE